MASYKDGLLDDWWVIYIEKEIFENVDNENILQRFQYMKSRTE
jgi:hypothetical protein